MADANTTASPSNGAEVSAVVETKLRQVAAILEAIYRMAKAPQSSPEVEVMELAGLAGELVFDIKTELGVREYGEACHV